MPDWPPGRSLSLAARSTVALSGEPEGEREREEERAASSSEEARSDEDEGESHGSERGGSGLEDWEAVDVDWRGGIIGREGEREPVREGNTRVTRVE